MGRFLNFSDIVHVHGGGRSSVRAEEDRDLEKWLDLEYRTTYGD